MDVPEIDVHELSTKLGGGALVVDVRQPAEYDAAHVPGAVLIPLDELVERVDEIPTAGTVYLICGSGPRSARAAQFLRAQGVDAVNVAGGTKGWLDAGFDVATGEARG